MNKIMDFRKRKYNCLERYAFLKIVYINNAVNDTAMQIYNYTFNEPQKHKAFIILIWMSLKKHFP